jgi:hypothetical protein
MNIWDIAETIFSPDDRITQPLAETTRKPVVEISSMLQIAVAIGLTASAVAGATVFVTPTPRCGVSEMSLALRQLPVALKRGPMRERRSGLDFVRAYPAEKLAGGFRSYFKPSTQIDDSSDEGYVFK